MAKKEANDNTLNSNVSPPAFLLSQVGAYVSLTFGERIAPLGITTPHCGILFMMALYEGLSQRQLALKFGVVPSRILVLIDELENLGLLERRSGPDDRRKHALYLTESGREMLGKLRIVAKEHEAAVLAPLEEEERSTLSLLLRKLADGHGLAPGVHPGYRKMSRDG